METVDICLGRLMQIHTFIRASVGADKSALGACSDVRMKRLKCMNIVAVVSFVSVVAQEPGAKVCYNSVNKFLNYQRRTSHAHSHRTTISQRKSHSRGSRVGNCTGCARGIPKGRN